MKDLKYHRAKVIAISTGHFLHDIYSSFLAPLLPLLIEKMNISLGLAGLLDLIRRIPSLLNPFIGLIADRAELKYMIILTPAITGISMSLMGLAPNYPTLAILLFVAGLSAAFFHVPSPVLINKFSGSKTEKGMSYYMFGGEIARTLGPLLITAAVSWWTLEGSYRVMPIGIFASIFLYFYLKDFKYCPLINTENNSINKTAQRKKYIPLFAGIGGYLFFSAGMKAFLTLYLVVYLVDKGASLWVSSISLSLLQLSGAAGALFAGFISNKLSNQKILLLSAFISPFLLLGLIYFTDYTIPLLILIGFSLFVSTPIIIAIVQKQASDRPAFYNSIYMTISFLINSIIVLLFGITSDYIGLESTVRISAFMAFASIAFVFILPRK